MIANPTCKQCGGPKDAKNTSMCRPCKKTYMAEWHKKRMNGAGMPWVAVRGCPPANLPAAGDLVLVYNGVSAWTMKWNDIIKEGRFKGRVTHFVRDPQLPGIPRPDMTGVAEEHLRRYAQQ